MLRRAETFGVVVLSVVAGVVATRFVARSRPSVRERATADIILGSADQGIDVQRPEPTGPIATGSPPTHAGIVRILGHPEFTDTLDRRAVFRKKKSLELLVWLCLNRDRMRRSAARTALWEFDVSDATFATVVSEMRRALREVLPDLAPGEIARATYTDIIDLTPRIVTDVDLLLAAHREFRAGGPHAALAEALRAVRDVPFAGVNYPWADGDGTTTRIVIAVIDAAVELAEWALAEGDIAAVTVALTAGLRTMPDHPDLLAVRGNLARRRGIGV
ncbi:MAG: hypothetical protein FJW53_07795 [Actinobacteria bacterium]|nr:hypothetical protein [Actinomycetota bacterium]